MSEFTLGSMYWINPKYTLEDFREDMRRVKENKITLLRTFIQWEYVEIERDKFDFTIFDPFFQAAEEAGIGVMPTLLFYLPFHRLVEQEENGRSDGRRRYPCLDRPEIREGLELFFSETVRRYKDSPALKIWNLWNEPTDGVCLCPHSLNRFAAWLKQKYSGLDALKEAWSSEYAIFKPLLPRDMDELNGKWLERILNMPVRGRDSGMRVDWFDFQNDNALEHIGFLKGIVRRYDPVHETHTNPWTGASSPCGNGFSPWLLTKVQESIGISVHPHHAFEGQEAGPATYPKAMLTVMDLVKSWSNGRDAWICEYQAGSTFAKPNAYTPNANDISAALYHALARGVRGVIFWQWQSWRSGVFEPGEFSLRNPSDGGPTERSEAARKFGCFLETYRPQLAGMKPPRPRVAILYSWDQCVQDQMQAAADFSFRKFYNMHSFAAHTCHKTLAKAGIPCAFLTESQLSDEVLRDFRVLILPMVRTVAPETAKRIAEFVRNGGAVWADGRCGFLDKHMFLRDTVPCNGLDRVFGCREIDEVAPREGDKLILTNGSAVRPYREIQRLKPYDSAEVLAECSGYPAAVRNHYGKGIAELWGTYLTGDPENDLSALLPEFAKTNGVQPEIRIQQGRDVIVSTLSGEDILLAIFTSLAETGQDIAADLPVAEGKMLNDVPAVLSGGRVEFTLRPGETIPLLIRTKKLKNDDKEG